MKKLSILFMAVLVAALAGCAGDTTSPDGDLSVVQDVQLDASSTGRTIVLTWTAVDDDIDGYKVFFRADETGSYTEVGDVTTTTCTHTADNAGDYVVIAYEGENTSSANSNAVSTMPNIISATYTIYDNYSADDKYSGFIFGETSGTPGMASESGFEQDIYAYQDANKGNTDVSLYSGNAGTFGNGNQSYFQEPLANGYCDPGGTWLGVSYELLVSDNIVFVKLPFTDGDAYVKMHSLSVTADPETTNGTIVSFQYEYQPHSLGLSVFTSGN